MPTIDDLRAVLYERESSAGDAHSVRAALSEPRQRNLVPPLAGAAAVLVVVGATAALAGTDRGADAGSQRGASSSNGAVGSASQATSSPPITTAPPVRLDQQLVWSFSVELTGYTVSQSSYTPYRQEFLLTPHVGGEPSVTVHLYPQNPSLSLAGASGQQTEVNGHAAIWRPEPTGVEPASIRSQLFWEYLPGAWGVVSGDVPIDEARRVAAAVQLGGTRRATEPFRLNLPSRFVVDAAQMQPRTCVGYGLGATWNPNGELGTVLTACRVHPGRFHAAAGDRTYTRHLPDGTVLVLAVASRHLDELSEADLAKLAATADTSPEPADPSTWLPVGR